MFLEAVIPVCVLLYCILLYFENFKNDRKPPGPIRIPPFGNLIQIGQTYQDVHLALHQMSKKHGHVMSIKMGTLETVIFSSYESMRAVFTKEETNNSRLCTGMTWDRNLKQNIGLIFCEGPEWIKTRKFCREALREYGYGNRETMRNMLLDELAEFFKYMDVERKSSGENKIHFHSDYFHGTFMNIMATWMMGKRFNYDDPEFQLLLKYENDLNKNGTFGAGLVVAYPWLRYIIPKALGYDIQMKANQGFHELAHSFLRQRKEKGEYNKRPICFTDNFLLQMELDASNPKGKTLFTYDHFGLVFCDILQAGTDTTSNVVNFITLHLLANQEIQDKLYQEISTVIGPNRLPSIEDTSSMQYTQAVILEGLRWSRVLALGVPRKASADFEYDGHCIKKGTVLMYNMHTIFFDEEFWGDPHIFRPERFFEADEKFEAKKVDRIQIVFGAGKRSCFGEVLARDSTFLFITSLFQRYKFTLTEKSSPPNLDPIVGFSLYAHAYDAIVTLR